MYKDFPKSELEKLKKINHCIYVDKFKAYKNCSESRNKPFDLENTLVYMYTSDPVEHMTYPLDLLYDDGKLYGYSMDYLKGYVTLAEYIKNPSLKRLSVEKKKKIIMDLCTALRTLNKYYSISDINNHNIMIDYNGNSAFIDWENGILNGETGLTLCQYDLFGLRSYNQEDAYKLFISMLSLYYEKNLERKFQNDSVTNIYEAIKDMRVKEFFLKFAEDFLYESCVGSSRTIYLDEYIKRRKK